MKSFLKKIIVTILTWEAKMMLVLHHPKIVAVTGTVGKTTTKDAIYSVLEPHVTVRKSQKSFNSELGVPLTILDLPNAWGSPIGWLANVVRGFFRLVFSRNYPEWLVLEIGADHPGDITVLTKWVKPDIAVVTKLSKTPVHVEFFHSVAEVINEKKQLVHAVKAGGTVILNSDDEDVMAFKDACLGRLITFGAIGDADIHFSHEHIVYDSELPVGMSAKIHYQDNAIPLSVAGTLGTQMWYPLLAALSVGVSLGFNLVELTQSLSSFRGPNGRMRLIHGVKGSVIIDDTYNASPVAVSAALKTLTSVETRGRKIAVIADMLELGKHSVDAHKKIGLEVAVGVDLFVCVGERMKDALQSALNAGLYENKALQFDTAPEAGTYLKGILQTGDVILVKGSQGMRMEKTVFELMEHPEQAHELLVRQEDEWRSR
ncbi:MAG: UDP-N-acetylmuramoyl-tripeptide--D-alanyl-D-alanine ligase [Patescibacteria group bacterium]